MSGNGKRCQVDDGDRLAFFVGHEGVPVEANAFLPPASGKRRRRSRGEGELAAREQSAFSVTTAPRARPRPSDTIDRVTWLAIFALTLSPPLAAWVEEIFQKGGIRVVLVRIPAEPETRSLAVPQDTPQRDLLEGYTSQPAFLDQFKRAEALTVNAISPSGRVSFILVNPRHAGAGARQQAVIAHELGHIWLKALRYPAPVYAEGSAACLAVHAGDAVQHVLIRKEATRRGFDWRTPWFDSLDPALAQMESESGVAPAVSRCQTLAQTALWVDVALGAGDWSRQHAFLAVLKRRFPAASRAGASIAGELAPLPLEDKDVHAKALDTVFTQMKALALSISDQER